MVTCCGGGHVDGVEGGARHRPSISNEAGKQRGGRRAVVRQRSQNANRELLHTHPPAAGSCRCDGRILAPAPLTLAYQRKLRRRARPHPGRCLLPRLDANLPQRRRRPRHPRPPPTPLYFHNPVQQQTPPRGRGGADFLFFSSRVLVLQGRYPRRRRFSFASNSILYVTPYTTTLTTQQQPYIT